MYLSDENKKHALKILTEEELLFGKITNERMLNLINRPSIRVVSLNHDGNFHGEFLWITFVFGEYYLQAYSMGFHEGKDRYITEAWSIVHYEKYTKKMQEESNHTFRMDRDIVTQTIEDERVRCEECQSRHKTSERGSTYEMLADMSDDDAAYSMVEDFEFLYGEL
jgi:hypothetical protein